MSRITWFFLLILVVGSAAAQPAPRLDAELFAREAQFNDVRLSPTGEYLAALIPIDGKVTLAVIRLSDKEVMARVQRAGSEDIQSITWVSPERLIYTVAIKRGSLDRARPTGELHAMNFDGTRNQLLYGARAVGRGAERGSARLLSVLRDEPDLVLIATFTGGSSDGTFPTVYRMNIHSGARLRVLSSPPVMNAQFVADAEGMVRAAYGDDAEGVLQSYWRDHDTNEWRLIPGAGQEHVRITPVFAAVDGSLIARISHPQGPDGLYHLDLQSGERRLVFRGEYGNPMFTFRSHDERELIGALMMEGHGRIELFEREQGTGRILALLQQSFPGQIAYFNSLSWDGKTGVVEVRSDRNAGDFYLFSLESGSAEYLVSRRDWLDPDLMAEMTPVHLKARDGLDLHGYITLPRGQQGPFPLIVHPHGGPHGVFDAWDFNAGVQFLANRGYAVLQINFRGSGGYGESFQRAGYLEWGRKMQDDVTDATHWAVEQGYADPERICIYGASYGGYSTMSGLTREPDLYRCGVTYVGVVDLEMMYTRGDIQQSLYGRNYLERVIGRDTEVLRERSPINHLEHLKAPVFIVHGERDIRVPFAHAQSLRRQLDRRNHPYEWLSQRREEHGFVNPDNVLDFYQRLESFFERHIGAGAQVDKKDVEES